MLRLQQPVATLCCHLDIHRIRIAEEIMHIPQYLLIGTHQKYAQDIRIMRTNRVQGQRCFDTFLVDIEINTPVGVTGQVIDNRPAVWDLIKPVYRHDRKGLVDCPYIRDRLKDREITEILVRKLLIQLIEYLALCPRS